MMVSNAMCDENILNLASYAGHSVFTVRHFRILLVKIRKAENVYNFFIYRNNFQKNNFPSKDLHQHYHKHAVMIIRNHSIIIETNMRVSADK